MFKRLRTAALLTLTISCASAPSSPDAPIVPASYETPPVGMAGDAADDPAIWVASDVAQSRVIGTQKKGGLFVYDLQGRIVQQLDGGQPNNVDLRDGFPWRAGAGPLVAASDRADNSVTLWRLDPATAQLETQPRARIATGFAEVYGICVGRMGEDFVVLATSKIGEVRWWRVREDGAEPMGAFPLGSIAEGCVIDDARGIAYVAEELVGVWRFALTDTTGAARTPVDRVGEGRLVADVEGLALWEAPGAGYLVVSVQGASRFAVYDAGEGNAYRGAFQIGPGAGADAVSGTDGLAIASAPLGPDFPQGLLVVQDDENTAPRATQDFKYVSWAAIAAALGL